MKPIILHREALEEFDDATAHDAEFTRLIEHRRSEMLHALTPKGENWIK